MSVKHCTCGSLTQVVDSRPDADGSIRRRRECPRCLKRITTLEMSIVKLRSLKEIKDRYDTIKQITNHPTRVR